MTLISHLGSHTHAASPKTQENKPMAQIKREVCHSLPLSSYRPSGPCSTSLSICFMTQPYTPQHQNTPVHKTSSNENKVNHGEQSQSWRTINELFSLCKICRCWWYLFFFKRSFNLKGIKTWPLLEVVKTIIGTRFSGTLKSPHGTKYLFFIWLSASRNIILSPRYKTNLGQN